MQQQKLNCYQCDGEECDFSEVQSSSICEDAVMCWKSSARAEGKETGSRGCISNLDQVPLYCNMHLQSGKRGHFRIQCCKENLCNGGAFPPLQNPPTDVADITNTIKLIVIILGPLVGLILLICGMYAYHVMMRTKNSSQTPTKSMKNKLVESSIESSMPANSSAATIASFNTSLCHEIQATACSDSTIKEYMYGHSLTSGSGSGLLMLMQRTLAQQVSLMKCLSNGGGKFGRQIWQGIWHGEKVAVKIYFSREEAMWARETQAYAYLLPSRHDYILGHVGSDMISQGSSTQLWLVSHYHEPGSLYNYLRQLAQPLNHHQMFEICLSITNGLLYLHSEIQGTQGKPAMAHRNLSSKSIIVKANGTCVIADLAHIVTQDRLAMDRMDLKQLSKRYMSPEMLEQTVDKRSLDSFRLADMYSLALVFWEVCRRCINMEEAVKYAAPYSEWLVNGDQEPTLEEMQKVVVTDQHRPLIPKCWESDPTLTGMGAIMEECWYTKAAARLPILRVKKSLGKLVANNPDVDMTLD